MGDPGALSSWASASPPGAGIDLPGAGDLQERLDPVAACGVDLPPVVIHMDDGDCGVPFEQGEVIGVERLRHGERSGYSFGIARFRLEAGHVGPLVEP